MSEDYIILDVKDNPSFHTIYEAINYCFGTNYTGWMKACWPNVYPQNNIRVWFPKLSRTKNGERVSEAFDCINYLSSDWNEIVFDDLKSQTASMRHEDHYWGNDIIFAKDPDGDYLFRGLFIRDGEKSSPNHCVSKRVATRIKLIRSPELKIEHLDCVGSLNDPLAPVTTSKDINGIVICICARCNTEFKLAKRCPDCGQMVDIRGLTL